VDEQLAPAEHCRACGAVLAPGAEWCSLCFASTATDQPVESVAAEAAAPPLERIVVAAEVAPPPPVVAGPPAHEIAGLPAHEIAGLPAVEPARVALAGPYGPGALHVEVPVEVRAELLPEQVVAGETSAVAVLPPLANAPTWPCSSCGHANPIAESVCVECGAGFLSEATHRPTLALPVVGDVFTLSKGQQIGVFGGAGVLLLLILLAVMAVLGAVL
jgi:hypothetical protein